VFALVLVGVLLVSAVSTLASIKIARNASRTLRARDAKVYSEHGSDPPLLIFPLHEKYLLVFASSELAVVLSLFLDRSVNGRPGTTIVLLFLGLASGSYRGIINAMAVLLSSQAMGPRAVKLSVIVGLLTAVVWGSILFILKGSTSDHHTSSSDSSLYKKIIHNLVQVYDIIHIVVYSVLWLAPLGYVPRRESIIVLARLISVYFGLRLLVTAYLTTEVGICSFAALHVLSQGILASPYLYVVFSIETQWWHGTPPDNFSKRLLCIKGQAEQQFTGTAGLELSGSSANAMSSVQFYLDGPRMRSILLNFSLLQIDSAKLLGCGSTARVYRGKFRDEPAAVKVLFTVDLRAEEIKRACAEATILKQLTGHAHVVHLFGVAVLPPSLCLVLELCSEGSLDAMLYNEESRDAAQAVSSLSSATASSAAAAISTKLLVRADGGETRASTTTTRRSASGRAYAHVHALPWGERLELTLGCCRGIEALCAVMPGYSHNDIKSANFLVHRLDGGGKGAEGGQWLSSHSGRQWTAQNENPDVLSLIAKVADVEMASQGVTPAHITAGGSVPYWTAPEVLAHAQPVSPASDVFALGAVFFEILARAVPFGNETFEQAVVLITSGVRPDFPPNPTSMPVIEQRSRKRFEGIVTRAWAQDPKSRMSASALASEVALLRRDFLQEVQNDAQARRRTFMHQLSATSTAVPAVTKSGSAAAANVRSSVDLELGDGSSAAPFGTIPHIA